MITRAQAAALAGDYQWTYDGDAVTNQHGDVVAQRVRIDEEGSLIAAAPDLARTVVALCDEVARLRTDLKLAQNSEAVCMEELAEKDNLLRLAEASVSLLRGDVDHARLELRRLRAAEAPGTDDGAFEGTGWVWRADLRGWSYGGGLSPSVRQLDAWPDGRPSGWVADPNDNRNHSTALDAMRAAVPGSV